MTESKNSDLIAKIQKKRKWVIGLTIVSVLLVYFLLPPFGIIGYITAVYVCELLNASLSLQKLFKISSLKIRIFSDIIAPILSIVASVTLCKMIFEYFNIVYSFTVSAVVSGIIVCLVLYYIFLRLTYSISNEDEKWFTGIFKRSKDT